MNSDFASYTLTNVFWKPKAGVREQLWVRAVPPGAKADGPSRHSINPQHPARGAERGQGW